MKKLIFLLLLLPSLVFGQTNISKWWKATPSADATIPTLTNGMWYYSSDSGHFTFYENGKYKHFGSATFSGLTDGPGALGGHALNFTRVNSGATALEYRTASQVLSDISGVSTARQLTINGTTYDLTADRTWTISTSTALSTLTDVNVSSIANNQFLQYQTSDNKWHNHTLVAGDIPTLNQNTTGSAATLSPGRNINGVLFDGSSNISVNLNNALTVDNSSLQLNTGTTFDGSAARTISIKNSGVTNSMLANSTILIAGNSTALGGSVTQDQITGLSSNGLLKRTSANTLSTAGIINSQSGTSYTLALSDAYNMVEFTNSSLVTVTIPANSSVAYDIGTSIDLAAYGATGFTVTGTGPVVIRSSSGSNTTSNQYLAVTLKKRGTDEWYLENGVLFVGAALTKTDDTNVTLTLGGTPSTALLQATSLTLGWSGTLAYSRFVNGGGLSVVGRSANSSGVQADITGTANQVLRVNGAGTTLGFGSIDLSQSAAVTNILPIANGGTGSSSGAWLLSGTSTLSGVATVTSNTASQHVFNGTWTASANNQNHISISPAITSRSTASDNITTVSVSGSITAASTSIGGVPLTVSTALKTNSGISTTQSGGVYVSKSTTNMTATTYTNVAPASTSGTGTGALFTVVVSSTVNFTSFTVTTAGSGYNVGETLTFNGSQFGVSGLGSITIAILTTSNSFGSNAYQLSLRNPYGDYGGITAPMINFTSVDGNTSYGNIQIVIASGAGIITPQLRINDAVGQMLNSDGTTLSTSRALSLTGTTTFTNTTTFSGSVVSSYSYSNSTGSLGAVNFTASPSVGNTGGILRTNIINTGGVTVGVPFTYSVQTAGSGYTAGNKTTTGGSGSGAQVTITVSGGTISTAVPVAGTAAGTGYAVNDVLNVSGGTSGQVKVTAVDQYGGIMSVAGDIRSLTDATSNNTYASYYSKPTFVLTGSSASTFFLYGDATYTSFGTGTKGGIAIIPTGTLSTIGGSTFDATFKLIGSGSNPTFKTVGAGSGTNYSIRSFKSDGTTEILSLLDNGNFAIAGTSTLSGGIVGVSDGSSASSGNVGQDVNSKVAVGSAVSLTTNTAANVTSISLTAGDWEVEGNVNFTETTATVTGRTASIGTTSATINTDGTEVENGVQSTVITEKNTCTIPKQRISISSTTTVYLVSRAVFSAGTCGSYGYIKATRIR